MQIYDKEQTRVKQGVRASLEFLNRDAGGIILHTFPLYYKIDSFHQEYKVKLQLSQKSRGPFTRNDLCVIHFNRMEKHFFLFKICKLFFYLILCSVQLLDLYLFEKLESRQLLMDRKYSHIPTTYETCGLKPRQDREIHLSFPLTYIHLCKQSYN